MEEKKKSSLVVFISILVALIGGVISVAYIVYKAMSNKSYEEKWKGLRRMRNIILKGVKLHAFLHIKGGA